MPMTTEALSLVIKVFRRVVTKENGSVLVPILLSELTSKFLYDRLTIPNNRVSLRTSMVFISSKVWHEQASFDQEITPITHSMVPCLNGG